MAWVRCFWNQVAANALGDIVGNIDETIRAINQGERELFRVEGLNYSGWLIVEMRRRANGEVVCLVHAYAGYGLAAGLLDLEQVAKGAGADFLECSAEKPGMWRMHESAGWQCISRQYERRINGQ
jgi:hypothetical protein